MFKFLLLNTIRKKIEKKNDESLSILSSMKKNRQFFSKLETTNEMNIENDFIRNEKKRNIASHAYANLIVKTRILSTKKFMSAIQTKTFQARFKSSRLAVE